MSTIPEGARRSPVNGPLARDVILDPDGSPGAMLAGAGVDDDGRIRSSFSDQHTFDNPRRVDRISLSFQAHDNGGAMPGVGWWRQGGIGSQDADEA